MRATSFILNDTEGPNRLVWVARVVFAVYFYFLFCFEIKLTRDPRLALNMCPSSCLWSVRIIDTSLSTLFCFSIVLVLETVCAGWFCQLDTNLGLSGKRESLLEIDCLRRIGL